MMYLLRQLLVVLRLGIGHGRGLRSYLSLPQAVPQISAGGEGGLVGSHGFEDNFLFPPELANGSKKESIEVVERISKHEGSEEKKGRGNQLAPTKAGCGTICNDWTSWGLKIL
jgi:hypothetical protein